MEPTGRKPRACVPCHQRKVRCDLTQVGSTPCSRCVNKNRSAACVMVSRPQPGNSEKRKHALTGAQLTANKHPRLDMHLANLGRNDNDALLTLADTAARTAVSIESGQDGADTQQSPCPPTPPTPAPPPQDDGTSPLSSLSYKSSQQEAIDPRLSQAPNSLTTKTIPQYTTSEDDAHLQTLHRMSDNGAIVLSPSSVAGAATKPVRRVFEYYSDFNALSILNEAIGRSSSRRKLVQVDLDGPQARTAIEREQCRLDKVDRAYLAQRRVFELPSTPACDALLRLFYKHVYPYTPVVDRVQLARDYQQQNCSTFLLYAMFAITVPYASRDFLHSMSFKSVTEAQREFFSRARLLYDFGCEKNQLNVLQGSILMSSFQNSFAPDKDFRFWFNNAIHISTLMGLHRQNIERELQPDFHRVCRRIWWLLFQRDIMFSLAGFENVRLINDDEVNSRLVCKDDWAETRTDEPLYETLPEVTNIQIQFFIENCKLVQLGARCLYLFRKTDSAPSMAQIREIGDAISLWRASLPVELRADGVTHWDESNVWITVILTFSFRLECLFYRTLHRRVDIANSADVTWIKQRLTGAMFDLSTVLRRAMAHEVLQLAPPSMLVCITQLLALQVQAVLSPDCSRGNRQALKAEIHTILAYLRDVEESWMNAKWACRVFGWVVKRTGLSLGDIQGWPNEGSGSGTGDFESSLGLVGSQHNNAQGSRQHHGQRHKEQQELQGAAQQQPHQLPQQQQQQVQQNLQYQQQEFDAAAYDSFRLLDAMEAPPEGWLQDLVDQGVLGDMDHGTMFDLFGAPYQCP